MKNVVRKIIIALHRKKVNKAASNKLNIIKKNVDEFDLSPKIINDYLTIWKPFKSKPSLLFLKCISSISGIKSGNYIPEDIHYNYVEPVLNSRPYALAYNDKNLFESLLPNHRHLFPHALLRGVNGVIYNTEYKPVDENRALNIVQNIKTNSYLVLKPGTETGGGDNVMFLEKTTDGFYILNSNRGISCAHLLNTMKYEYSGNFIFQDKIVQHEYFHNFNHSSLNTVRLYTYRSVKDESIIPLHAYIRFGKSGSLVDSSSQGGRTCGVFMDGTLNSFAIGKYGEKYLDIDWVNLNNGKPVPKFLEMKQLANEIAPVFRFHRLLGFDFSLDENEDIRLLEVNNLYIGVINQQMNTGPLFGEYTDDVIEFCRKNKKSYNHHFYL